MRRYAWISLKNLGSVSFAIVPLPSLVCLLCSSNRAGCPGFITLKISIRSRIEEMPMDLLLMAEKVLNFSASLRPIPLSATVNSNVFSVCSRFTVIALFSAVEFLIP